MPESNRDGRPTAQPPLSSLRRRRFLFALGAGSAGAAAAAAAPAVTASVAAPAPTTAASSGYRVTEHIRDYYESTRL